MGGEGQGFVARVEVLAFDHCAPRIHTALATERSSCLAAMV